MSKRTCGQVLVLPSRRLVRPVADYDFVLVLLGDRFLSNIFLVVFGFYSTTQQRSYFRLPSSFPLGDLRVLLKLS